MALEMDISWDGYCNICMNPLDINVSVYGKNSLKILYSFSELYPFEFDNNESRCKFMNGPTWRKLCRACYSNAKCGGNHNLVMNREYENCTRTIEISSTKNELKEWGKNFEKFVSRKDLDSCLLPLPSEGLADIDLS